ncbi:hypothetical protein HDU98_010473 [Podochytrium sp. JEL0797]|nr:hypothetical protein HDU98_010473 [Podochytrium sp. JEL0797]
MSIDATRIPILVIWCIGLLTSGSLLLHMVWGKQLFKSTLGALVTFLVGTLVLYGAFMVWSHSAQVFYPTWFETTDWPKQVYGSVLSGGGVPTSYKVPIPGAPLQSLVCLISLIHFLPVTFVTMGFLYFRTFQTVNQSISTMSAIAIDRPSKSFQATDKSQSKDALLRKRVVTNCLLVLVSFAACYSMLPSLIFYNLMFPEWTCPDGLEIVGNCLLALDGVVTPLMVLHLNRGVVDGKRKSGTV